MLTERVNSARAPGADRSAATREALLSTAERLFAEQGLSAVSNRLISAEAGQGNNAAANYHFGSRSELLRAIERKHRIQIDEVRVALFAETADSTELRDWVALLVRPLTDHLEALGNPSWYARFAAQAMADPVFRQIVTTDALASPLLGRTLDGIMGCLPKLDRDVRYRHTVMTRNLLMHTCAELEGELAAHGPDTRWTWRDAAEDLTDAIVRLWQVPAASGRKV
ncbi:TetR/AcrR family transcriptional regulator [Nocardia bovistercoris]|uniref:TetR/AcrR family transcriptional regulator n=1 Tax=Nocardia bovistercoris TaxID=2785916 RepID=A0A931IGK9_9NOCA|nr:TetR/AcrR family transcriptional regulator [Nocardia bovistercoris]MBH0779642.1 TetR/AcrR family transcriptional regulator [Nocardia bovistercoris]